MSYDIIVLTWMNLKNLIEKINLNFYMLEKYEKVKEKIFSFRKNQSNIFLLLSS